MIYTIKFELPDNETVIKNIKTARVSWSVWGYSGVTHAQPVDKDTNVPCTDTISRQTAMEEISKQQTYKMFEGEDTLYLDANDVGSVLASLPSEQPEIIRCKDCKHHGTNGYRLNCAVFCCTMPDDGFCSCGERREDG